MIEPTRIIAIRHGETTWNVDARIQGSLDIPLNATGQAQALRLATALAGEPIRAIYASDLSRAWETAQHLGRTQQLEVVPEKGLRERRFGEFEGKTFRENLGVPIPKNMFSKNRVSVQVPPLQTTPAAAFND